MVRILPAISRIRLTNIIYENGGKRFNDEIFEFDGYNGVILLANGGGKTVLIQTALQAVLPHTSLGERKIKDTLSLEGGASHVAIEWILNDRPRRYGLTAVTLFLAPEGLKSLKYAYDYSAGEDHSIENIPFVKQTMEGDTRPASRQEMQEYYQYMQNQKMNAHTFDTIKDFHQYIEENFHIVPSEWRSIAHINGAEGDVEKFFDGCKTTSQLVNQLLIPVVEGTLIGGTEDFVQIFERQREHFKKHKELRTRIEESKSIEEKISQYVSTYTKLYEVEEKMLSKKKEAKSIYKFFVEEKEKTEDEIDHIKGLEEILLEKKYELKRKNISYELALLNKELEGARDEYEIIKSQYMDWDNRLKTKENALQNLEIAELKSHIKQKEERIGILKKQLEELDEDEDIIDLKDRLEENSSTLRGYFEREIVNLGKQKTIWENQRDKYQDLLQKIHQNIEQLKNNKQNLIEGRAGDIREIKGIEDRMKNIKKDVLANPTKETIEGEYPKWRQRTEEIEGLNISYMKRLKVLRERKAQLSIEISNIHDEIQKLIEYTTLKDRDLESIDEKHREILSTVKGLRLEWHYLDSIYLKQRSISQYMEERLERTRNEKEKLLEKERISYRLLDYYGENEYFTGEPLLEEWVNSWRNQFNLLEIGTRYIEKGAANLNKNIEEIYMAYPLWALAVITSEGEVGKLYKKIEEQRERLTLPILILSQEEASNMLLGKGKIEERYIYPRIWQDNVDKEEFQLWKNGLEKSVKEAVKDRKEKETEEKYWQDILVKTTEFLLKYPYDEYIQLVEEVKSLKDKLHNKRNLLDEKRKESGLIDREIDDYQTKMKDLEQEANYLDRRIEKALDYFEKAKDRERINNLLYQKNEQLILVEKDILRQKKDRDGKEAVIREVEEGIRDIDNQIHDILTNPYYREVEDFKPLFRNLNKDSILEEREYIKDRLLERQKGRPEIVRELKETQNIKAEYEEQLRRKYASANYPVDEDVEYPYNGSIWIQGLLKDIRGFKEEIDKILPYLNEKEDLYKHRKYIYEERLSSFHEEFEEIVNFTQPLPSVKKQLAEEELQLDEKQTYIETSYERLKEQLEEIQDNIKNMDIKNGKYEFLIENIEEAILSSDIEQNLPYDREGIVSKMFEEMEKLTRDLEAKREKVIRDGNQFIQFLNVNVKDVRLREMAASGIRNKDTFDEILDWQKNMNRTINRAIRIHEKNMMEHDRELNQFIQYLYTYLNTLADELRAIPKNTRVKLEDDWKEIFQIQVPTWEEEEGKEEVRRYVDWMIGNLEKEEFLDEEGREDQGKVKKAIETWFQSKQLLTNIMGGKEIKVRCRKVTNDGNISNMYYAWESSNLWSGGEKWSKNMALFLGVLNYVAEKKQHILPNQKRHGTVIMDNPFGKASSDHVLSPVFFIAEQLGFQFIALTAHGEGRFIRDYFPVVYSCKLRPSMEGDTSILTKEKSINYAFFKDNDPMAIERIGDREQLSLFEI